LGYFEGKALEIIRVKLVSFPYPCGRKGDLSNGLIAVVDMKEYFLGYHDKIAFDPVTLISYAITGIENIPHPYITSRAEEHPDRSH
jgi:hypothetical protein